MPECKQGLAHSLRSMQADCKKACCVQVSGCRWFVLVSLCMCETWGVYHQERVMKQKAAAQADFSTAHQKTTFFAPDCSSSMYDINPVK